MTDFVWPTLKKLPVAFVILSLLFNFSCTSDPDKTGGENTEETTEAKTPKRTATAPTTINQVNVFLEISGSMKGFMPTDQANGITEFQKTIDPFLATIQQNNNIKGKSFYEVKEKPYPTNYDQLARTVRYGIPQAASSTTIPAILDSIITNNPNGVNVLISDFIYSPENGRAVSFVSTDIYRVLANAKQQGQAISIYGATSSFNGTFYPAVKTTRKTIANCCEAPVPYYVWVIGKPEQVSLFNREIVKNNFTEELHAGFTFEAPAYSVIDNYKELNIGEWYCLSENNVCHIVTLGKSGTPNEMVIGIDLSKLPPSFGSESYLKQNLKLTADNTDAQINNIYPAAQFKQLPGVSGKNNDPLKPYTHFVKVKLTKLNAPQANLHFTLANHRPAWVQQWSTPDDSNINTEGSKTFNLAGILDGVDRAFNTGTSQNIVDIAVTLRKEK